MLREKHNERTNRTMMTPYAPYVERPHPTGDGIQKLYRFDNGYGASVVRFSIGGLGGSYGFEEGHWELAVVVFKGDGSGDYTLTYATPITDDVLGHCTLEEIEETLQQIEALPARPESFQQAKDAHETTVKQLLEHRRKANVTSNKSQGR